MADIVSGSYLVSILWKICVYAIVALSLNWVIGYCGMFNLGQVGFFAVGALCSTLAYVNLVKDRGMPMFIGVVAGIAAGIALSAALAVGIGVPSLRLRGDYFAIATLGFGEIVRVVIKSDDELTSRPPGIDPFFSGAGMPKLGGVIASELLELLLVFICLIGIFLLMQRLAKSPFGRLVKAVRDDEEAAAALGKNVFGVKLRVFIIGAAIASFAGSLFVHHVMVFKADDFNIMLTIMFLVIVIFGGLGSGAGMVIGTVSVVLIDEIPKLVGTKVEWLADYTTGPMNLLIFSVIIILFMLFRPKGLMAGKEFFNLRGTISNLVNRNRGVKSTRINDRAESEKDEGKKTEENLPAKMGKEDKEQHEENKGPTIENDIGGDDQ